MNLFSLFSRKKPKPVFSTEDYPQPLRADICEGQRWLILTDSLDDPICSVEIKEISMSGKYIKVDGLGWVPFWAPFSAIKFVERIRDCN